MPAQTEWSKCDVAQNSVQGRLHRLFLSQIVLLTQQHNFRHVTSCFKSSIAAKSGECRYSFPRKGGTTTHVDECGRLILGRRHHHEYINPCSDILAHLLRSNHDIRVLVRCSTTDAFYYCMKYATKVQTEIESIENVLLDSYDRRARKETEREANGIPLGSVSVGRSKVNSMAIYLEEAAGICSNVRPLFEEKVCSS